MNTIQQLHQRAIPIQSACTALALPRSSYYRHQALSAAAPPVKKTLTLAIEGERIEPVTAPAAIPDTPEPEPATPDKPVLLVTDTRPAPSSRRALSAAEEATVYQILHSDRFVDSSPLFLARGKCNNRPNKMSALSTNLIFSGRLKCQQTTGLSVTTLYSHRGSCPAISRHCP